MSQVKKIPMRKCVGCQEMKSKREDDPHPENRKRRDHPGCDRKEKRQRCIYLQIRGMP